MSLTIASRSSSDSLSSFFCDSVAAVTASSTLGEDAVLPDAALTCDADAARPRGASRRWPARLRRRGRPTPLPLRLAEPLHHFRDDICDECLIHDPQLQRCRVHGARFTNSSRASALVDSSLRRLIKRLPAERRRVDDADDHRVGRQVLGLLGHAGAGALHDQHQLPFAAPTASIATIARPVLPSDAGVRRRRRTSRSAARRRTASGR